MPRWSTGEMQFYGVAASDLSRSMRSRCVSVTV